MKKIKCLALVFVLVLTAAFILPQGIFADDDVFAKILTDGKLVVNGIKPTNIDEAWVIVGENTIDKFEGDYYLDWSKSFNEDYTECTIYYGRHEDTDKSKKVEIVYNYDKDVKKVVDTIIKKLPEGQNEFSLTDMEYVNYLLNALEANKNAKSEADLINIATYSGELKKLIDYKNFAIEPRMGDGNELFMVQYGTATFKYDGAIYSITDGLGVKAENVIYVNSDVTDLKKAIEDKITSIFGDKKFTVEKYKTKEEFLNGERTNYGTYYDQNPYMKQAFPNKDDYINMLMNEYYLGEDASCKFLKNAENDLYVVKVNGELLGIFAVIKDSKKANVESILVTNDVNSDVTISTTSKSIPLDTLISVAKITSGAEYDKIIKILEVANSEMFDLKLYSKSLAKNITKLDDGTFEVKIPVSEKFKDKDLVVYFVDENDNVKEYKVTVKDGYAIFTTDHFSIYTLAEKKVEEKKEEQKDNKPADYKANPDTGRINLSYTDLSFINLI